MRSLIEKQKALTFRSLSALLFGILIIQPAIIYYNLLTNEILPLQGWIVILLWAEISRFFGIPLSIKELFVLMAFQGMVTSYALVFKNVLFNMYLTTTYVVHVYGIDELMPSWWAPPPDISKAFVDMGPSHWIFFDPVWLSPLLLIVLVPIILDVVAKFAIGFFCYERYVVIEKLDFPAATAQALTIRTLAEREPDDIRVLMISSMGGIIFSLLTSFIPFIAGPFLTGGVTTIAIPRMVDLTPTLSQIFPGMGFSMTGDVIYYLVGFLVPTKVCAAMFIGAISLNSFGTHIVTRLGLWPKEALAETIASWSVFTLLSQAHLYFYANVWIGLSLAATITPLILKPRSLLAIFYGTSQKERGKTLYLLLSLFFISTTSSVLINGILTSFRFPVWVLLLYTVFWSLFASLVSTQAAGITYQGLNIPYQRELLIYFSGYRDRDIWFAPVQVFAGGAEIAQSFKIADICLTSHKEYIITYVLVVFLGLASSFFYTSLFWFIQPLPSYAYPATIYIWPVDATNWVGWQERIWTGFIFRSSWIVGSFGVGVLVYLIATYLLGSPYFLISFVAGFTLGLTPTGGIWGDPVALTLANLIGSIIGNRFVASRMGESSWNRYKWLIVVGFGLGSSFVEVLKASLIMIQRSMWLTPF